MFFDKAPSSVNNFLGLTRFMPWLSAAALVACALSVALYGQLQQQEQTQKTRNEVRYQLEQQANEIDKIISQANASLRAIEVFVRQTPQISQTSFEQFSQHLSIENPAIRSLQYAPNGILTYVTNTALNKGAIGLNLYQAPKTAPYVEEAALTGKTVMEGPRELVQGGSALILRYPAYLERRADKNLGLLGFAAVLIDFEYMKLNIIEPLEKQGLVVQISQKSPMHADWIPVHGNFDTQLIEPVSSAIFFPYGEWNLQVAPAAGWDTTTSTNHYFVLMAILVMGAIIVISIAEFRSRQRFQSAFESVKTTNDLKDRLIANVSHEIRTPLSSINNIAIMMEGPIYSDDVREFGRSIRQASQSISTVVNDLLDLSKIRQGHFRLSDSKFDLDDLVERIANMLQHQWLHKPAIEPIVIEPKAGQRSYTGDLARIEQVIQNLISNAYKFTMFGHVKVQIDVQTQNRDIDSLILTVIDSGVGISKNDIEHVFEAFYQVDSSLQKKYNGAGLGLAICRQIVEVMGGTIGVQSKVNHGSQFEIKLPLKRAESEFITHRKAQSSPEKLLLVFGDEPLPPELNTALEPYWLTRFLGQDASTDRSLPVHDNARILVNLKAPLTSKKIDWLNDFLGRNEHLNSQTLWLGSEIPQSAAQRGVRQIMKPLTRRRLDRAHRKPAEYATRDLRRADTPPLRLLLAEDNALNAKVLKKLLENRGAQVTCVSNGADALALLSGGAIHFDAVLMDLQMPVMDGLEATRLIRRNQDLQSLLVYAVSGHASNSMKKECADIGFTNFITKPFDPDLLIEDVQNRIQNLSRSH